MKVSNLYIHRVNKLSVISKKISQVSPVMIDRNRELNDSTDCCVRVELV